jgi:hypothetical protein
MSWKDILKNDDDRLEYVYDGVYMRPSDRRGGKWFYGNDGGSEDQRLDITITVLLEKEESKEPIYDVSAQEEDDGDLDWNAEWLVEGNYINPEQIEDELDKYLLDKYKDEGLDLLDIDYTYFSYYINEDIKEGGMPLEDSNEHSSLAEAINYLKSKPQPN